MTKASKSRVARRDGNLKTLRELGLATYGKVDGFTHRERSAAMLVALQDQARSAAK